MTRRHQVVRSERGSDEDTYFQGIPRGQEGAEQRFEHHSLKRMLSGQEGAGLPNGHRTATALNSIRCKFHRAWRLTQRI